MSALLSVNADSKVSKADLPLFTEKKINHTKSNCKTAMLLLFSNLNVKIRNIWQRRLNLKKKSTKKNKIYVFRISEKTFVYW